MICERMDGIFNDLDGSYQRPGVGRRHGAGAGTNLAMASATATGLSTGTHVLAPGTETSVARGNSDASRRASVIGKKSHDSPQISRTGRSKRGIASAASMSSCGRKPAEAATRSSATRRSRRAGPKNDSARSWSSPLAATAETALRRPAGDRFCSRSSARASRGEGAQRGRCVRRSREASAVKHRPADVVPRLEWVLRRKISC